MEHFHGLPTMLERIVDVVFVAAIILDAVQSSWQTIKRTVKSLHQNAIALQAVRSQCLCHLDILQVGVEIITIQTVTRVIHKAFANRLIIALVELAVMKSVMGGFTSVQREGSVLMVQRAFQVLRVQGPVALATTAKKAVAKPIKSNADLLINFAPLVHKLHVPCKQTSCLCALRVPRKGSAVRIPRAKQRLRAQKAGFVKMGC